MKGRKEVTRWRGVDLPSSNNRTIERHRHSVPSLESKSLIRRASLVIRVNVNEIVNGMMVGMGIVQRGAQGRRCNGGGGWWMIDRLHRGYGRHLIGGTGRHLVHGTGRGHRAP